MHDFLGPKKPFIQSAIISRTLSPGIGELCACDRGLSRLYRCSDCDSNRAYCIKCIVASHNDCYFHWAEKWNGTYFERTDMHHLGLRIYMGHGGTCCPKVSPSSYVPLRVVDCNGFHDCRVIYCHCVSKQDVYLQLLESGLFPSSLKQPVLAFTFRCLQDFSTQTHASRKSAFDYMKAIQRKTNDLEPNSVAVSPPSIIY